MKSTIHDKKLRSYYKCDGSTIVSLYAITLTMKKLLMAYLIACCYACNSDSHDKIYNPDALSPEYFTIDLSEDTVLQTAKGATIFIPAGAIRSDKGSSLRLQIKEAYSIADIVQAGLLTQGNGQPMSSGGMLQILPVGDECAVITGALRVKIPGEYIKPWMKLYKGEQDKIGNINWTTPQVLLENPLPRAEKAGKDIFQLNCASCHSMIRKRKLTGPGLLHITARHPRKWLIDYINDNEAVMAGGDCYAKKLFEEYNKNMMTRFPELKGKDMDDLLYYMESISRQVNNEKYNQLKKQSDSCEIYLKARNEWQQNQHVVKAPRLVEAGHVPGYRFEITSFGWLNVDALLDKIPGFTRSYLSVRVASAVSSPFSIFLIIPADKIFLTGGLLKGRNNEYGFFTEDGYITLPLNKRAYVVATGLEKDHFLMGTVSFETTNEQRLQLALQPLDKAAFNHFIRQLDLQDLSLKVKSVPKEIIIVDTYQKEVGKWKPVDFDCGCDLLPTTPAPAPGK
jgi:cytochrome c2